MLDRAGSTTRSLEDNVSTFSEIFYRSPGRQISWNASGSKTNTTGIIECKMARASKWLDLRCHRASWHLELLCGSRVVWRAASFLHSPKITNSLSYVLLLSTAIYLKTLVKLILYGYQQPINKDGRLDKIKCLRCVIIGTGLQGATHVVVGASWCLLFAHNCMYFQRMHLSSNKSRTYLPTLQPISCILSKRVFTLTSSPANSSAGRKMLASKKIGLFKAPEF